MRTAARDSVVRRAVAASHLDSTAALPSTRAALAAVNAHLARMLTPADSGLSVELLRPDGRRIAAAGLLGADSRGGEIEGFPIDRRSDAASSERPPGLGSTSEVVTSPLYLERGEVHFSAIAPIDVDGKRAGYLLRRYRIGEGRRAEETIHALAGPGVTMYYHNPDGTQWTTIAGKPSAAPQPRDSSESTLLFVREGVGPVLTTQERVKGAPLLLSFEVPLSTVLAAPRQAVTRLSVLALVLTLFGAAVSSAASRRVTRPIAALTAASESIARGDDTIRVPPEGHDEIARLAASFNRMAGEVGAARRELETQAGEAMAARAQAETASRAKSEFLTVMSHELRTPLNAIAGYTELLQMELRGPITDAQRRDLERIRSSSQHLLGLIGSVLDLSRIEAGRVTYELQPIAVDPFLAGLDSLVAPQASDKSLTLEYVGSAPNLGVIADREKLRQIMLNLLSNAIRYTPPGGRVTLSAKPSGDANVSIVVSDTGEGVPADARQRIFEPFVQLDRTLARSREGVGLGLAISRDLARGMGGDLTLESAAGAGSSFIVTLQAAVVEPGTGVPPHSGEMPSVRGT